MNVHLHAPSGTKQNSYERRQGILPTIPPHRLQRASAGLQFCKQRTIAGELRCEIGDLIRNVLKGVNLRRDINGLTPPSSRRARRHAPRCARGARDNACRRRPRILRTSSVARLGTVHVKARSRSNNKARLVVLGGQHSDHNVEEVYCEDGRPEGCEPSPQASKCAR